jgi:orotidine-5'-phosphate decarboxylase
MSAGERAGAEASASDVGVVGKGGAPRARGSAGGAELSATPIVALDFPSWQQARELVHLLGAHCRFYKVGLELFIAEGPQVVQGLRDEGCDVFLDLKLHDIPATMRGAARSAARLGASLLTVHASAGEEGVRAAVEGAGAETRILAVTVLTSLDGVSLATTWGRGGGVDVEAEVLRLAGVARAAGAHGVVCSGHEAESVRAAYGSELVPLVPGIRLPGGDAHDQRRVMTPGQAARAGAGYLVLGRAVRAAADPVAAMEAVNAELELAARAG